MLAPILMVFVLFWTWAKVLKFAHMFAVRPLTFRSATGRRVDDGRNWNTFIVVGEKGDVTVPVDGISIFHRLRSR
jgi:hypothetical protein